MTLRFLLLNWRAELEEISTISVKPLKPHLIFLGIVITLTSKSSCEVNFPYFNLYLNFEVNWRHVAAYPRKLENEKIVKKL